MDSVSCGRDLDEEKAKRSILVTNVPQNISLKDVIIHFQKRSNGGGEVDDESCGYFDPEDQASVTITFDDPSTVETAISHAPHIIGGMEVNVQQYSVAPTLPEIFSDVQAKLNPDIFASDSTVNHVLHILHSEYGIKFKEKANKYVISGSYQQIKSCYKYILEEVSKKKLKEPRRSRSKHRDMGARARTSDDCGATEGYREESDDEESTKEIDVKLFQTVPIILEFIFTVQKYKKRIKAIESEFSVNIYGAENGSKVGINPTANCTQPKYYDACEEYIKLYREITDGNMMCKDLVLKPGKGSNYLTADEAVKEVLEEAPVVIQELEEPDTWLFYGEDANVRSAINDVCKKLKMDNPFGKARKVKAASVTERKGTGATVKHLASWGREKDREDQRENPNDQKSPLYKHFSVINDGFLKILTKKGFQLSVHQGDITQERVGVIINSIGEFLSFLYGLPASLVKMGGSSIEKEAVAESKRKKTKPGDLIMTGPGKLDCLKVIHILTWKFSKKNSDVCKRMVKESCLASLKRTEREKLKSIAFPAVGSGQQGMPLDICATAMFNAVEEYMKVSDPKKGAVTDIRFVHLDPSAVEVFEAELTKRYGDSISASTARSDTRKDKYNIRTTPDSSSVDKKITAKDEEDVCPICLDGFHDPVTLQKCNHQFCRLCIDKAFKHRKACPTCGMSYGVHTGNMPQGTMNWRSSYFRLPGYESYYTIEIMYSFPSGTQGPEHPNPGQYYHGTSRTAYLPDCPEGREVLGLLKKAFDARLTFTIGTSVTTGATNTVTWNDIHHKTSTHGGATNFGYPDPTYLQRVKAELAAKGIS